jgi:DNA repair exonuclease SbcCD ATPase subunit
MEASKLTQGSPHADNVWQQAITKWQESVDQLKTIPSGTSVSGDAQEKLSAYQGNLAAVQGRFNAEQKAVQDFDTAKQLASEAINLTQNPPYSSSVWQESAQKWQQAINLLKGVPNGTTVYQDASGRISSYQGNLATINANLQKQIAAEAFERLRPQIQSVVDQFSATDSRLDVGMNYSQYSEDIRELKVALDQLGRQPGAKNLAVYKSLENAFNHYDVAQGVWQYYLSSNETHSFIRANGPYGSLLMYTYGVPTSDIMGTPYIYLNTALSKVWGYASLQVNSAQNQI